MNEEEEIHIEQMGSVEIYQQQERAVIDVQIATAKQYPRNLKRAVDNSIATVTLDKDTAATCNYSLPRGGKTISGPSVHLAKVLAQFWGNMRIEAKVVSIDATSLTSQAVAFDLENNLAIKVEIKRSIMTKKGRMDDSMIVVTGNAANSIALRNAVFTVIPKAVVDKVYNAAKQFITGDLSDETKLIKRRKEMVDFFKNTHGVEEAEVLSVIGKKTLSAVTSDDIMVLIGLAQAIKDGDTSVDLAFKKSNPKVDSEMERFTGFLANCKTLDELDILLSNFDEELPAEMKSAVELKRKELSK